MSLSYGYSGKAYTPELTVKVDGITLKEGTHYTVVYKNNINPGTAKITVTGIGKCIGTRIKTFEIVQCVSSLVSGKTYQLIPKNNSATAVCAFAGRMVKNTKVYITDRSSSEAMKFIARKNSDGTWKFINAKCELALAVQQNSAEPGKSLVLYDQTTRAAQNWKLSRKSDNSFAIINAVSGLSVAMSDSSAVKGTTLSMAKTVSSGLQRFYIVETNAVNVGYDGTYTLKASANKKFALTVDSASKSDGANVIQNAWVGQNGQRWKITKNSNGTFTLKNALGTVLHLNGNKASNGTNVVARNAASTGAQKWYME